MKRPRLHLDDLESESTLLGLVDELLLADDNYKLASQKILAAQDRLQALTDTDAWLAFLELEALVNERSNFMMAIAVRWAFHEGRRSRRGAR